MLISLPLTPQILLSSPNIMSSINADPSNYDPSQIKHMVKAMAFNKAVAYSTDLWFCICAFWGILLVVRITSSLFYCLRRRRLLSETPRPIFHAFVNIYRIVFYRTTLSITPYYQSSIAQVSIISGYLLALLILQFIDCHNPFTGVTLDIHYWSVRAGVMAMNQLFLLQALVAKHNIIFDIVGISYEKRQVFHRVLGRISVALVWLHAGSHIAMGLKTSGLALQWQIMGILAASAYTAMFLSSTYSFRKRHYEVFLTLHMTLATIIVIAVYFHVNHSTSFNDTAMLFFIFWVADRSVRTFRPYVYNFLSGCRRRVKPPEKDTIQLISDSVMLITLHRSAISWKAGQHMYLRVPSLSRFPLEAHPFSIASVKTEWSARLNNNDPDILRFIIRAKDGFTRRLLDSITIAGVKATSAVPMPMPFTLLDGPYGYPPKVGAFKNVILIAGGTGISFTLPLFQHIVRESSKRSLCRSVSFCWIVSHIEEFSWVSSQLLVALNATPHSEALQIEINLFVTRSPDSSHEKGTSYHNYITTTGHPLLPQEFLAHESVTLEMGKPDIKHSLREKVENCVGSTIVAVSGPASLANDVRHALRFELGSKVLRSKEIYLHVETYCVE